jgi:hypothetical protein
MDSFVNNEQIDEKPYEPTAADWAEYAAWVDKVAATEPAELPDCDSFYEFYDGFWKLDVIGKIENR